MNHLHDPSGGHVAEDALAPDSGAGGPEYGEPELDPEGTGPEGGASHRRRVVWTVGGLLLLLAIAGGWLLMRPTGSRNDTSAAATGSSTAQVLRQTLTAQTQLNGTLGYGGAQVVTTPTGTASDALRQAIDAVAAAQATLSADQTAAADGSRTGRQDVTAAEAAVRRARGTLDDAKQARARACSAGASAACTAARQQVSEARGQLLQARTAETSATGQAMSANHQAGARVAADRAALASAQAALASARSRATNGGVTYTAVAAVGTTVRRGQRLYAVDGVDVPLFYGSLTPWRALYVGVSPGRDVAALNDNLAALGYDASLAGSRSFTSATRRAVERWQKDIGAAVTGTVALGDLVYRPDSVVVTAVTAAKGQAVQPGSPVLTTSSTSRVVTVSLDAGQQGQVKVGDDVTVTLPDSKTVSATVASVGTVATAASGGSGAGGSGGSDGDNGSATIQVKIRLNRPKAAAGLDQAPVLVGITTATVKDALVVPVNALLALAGGGYAVEVVDADGAHHLVAVTPGTFDDAKGLVQVTGSELKAGQRVVVPSS